MIDFCFEEIDSFEFNQPQVNSWLADAVVKEGYLLGEISVVFCSDDYLLEINKKHLEHDYYTDIITFNYNEDNCVSGDLFISVTRVEENASEFNVLFLEELKRVLVHGVLHLCGYKDKTEEDILIMRSKENYYLKQK